MEIEILFNNVSKKIELKKEDQEQDLKEKIQEFLEESSSSDGFINPIDELPMNPAVYYENRFKQGTENSRLYNVKMSITGPAFDMLVDIDSKLIGSYHYMGLSFFWNYEYRHYLRDNSKFWVDIHTDFLNEGLNVTEVSDKHLKIIKKYIKE